MKLELDPDIQGILEPERAFDRRDFLATALGAERCACRRATAFRRRTIVTDSVGLDVGEVKMPVKDGKMPAIAPCPRPAVHSPWSWSCTKCSGSIRT